MLVIIVTILSYILLITNITITYIYIYPSWLPNITHEATRTNLTARGLFLDVPPES